MRRARRSFLKQFAGVASVLVGGAQLVGCLGESDSQESAAPAPAMQSSPVTATAPTPGPTPAGPSQTAANSAPIWDPLPSIEFVEGVPAVVSVRNFVRDPDGDPLVITLNSGTLLPGITWNPSTAVLAYDGRPLGAKPGSPVVLTGLTFSADDRRN